MADRYTRELRRKAMALPPGIVLDELQPGEEPKWLPQPFGPRWGCDHARRTRTASVMRSLGDWELDLMRERGVTATFREAAAQELAERHRPCPACENQNRRNSRHWSALALAAVLLLVIGVATCSARGATFCGDYTPTQGARCVPPHTEKQIGNIRICVCPPGGKMARR